MKNIRWDAKSNGINIDRSEFFDRHKVVYDSRIDNPKDGVTLGTGKVGAIFWHTDSGMAFQVNNVDASPQTQVASGIVALNSPQFLGEVKSVLNFFDGSFIMSFASGCTIECSAGGCSNYFVMKVSDCANLACEVSFDLFQPEHFGEYGHRYYSYLKNYNDWKSFDVCNGDDYIAIAKRSKSDASRAGGDNAADISDETVYGNTLAVKTVGDFVINKGHILVRGACEIVVANPSLFDKETVNEIFNRVDTFASVQLTNKLYWNQYFSKTFVSFDCEDSDYLENLYYISQYVLACGMRGKMPLHFINGVFRSEKDENLNWAPAYWWYNQRCLYGGMNSSGHSENILSMINLYLDNEQRFRQDTSAKYPSSQGFIIPETCGWDGNRFWTDGVDIVETIHASSIEICLMMYDYYLYTHDTKMLDRFVRFSCGVADFYITTLLSRDEQGHYSIQKGKSNARESFVLIADPVCDIAGIKALFPLLYNYTKDEKYNDIVCNLVDFHMGKFPERLLAGADESDYVRRNVDEPTLEALYPFNLSVIGDALQPTLKNNYEFRIGRNETCRFISWDNSGIWAARLGLGDDVFNFNIANIALTQKHANGLGTDGNCVYEYNGNIITSINESLLQSHGGIITVFPAVPKGLIGFNPMFTLFARGGFVVTSEFDFVEMVTRYISIESKIGNDCSVRNVWGQEAVVYCGTEKILTSSGQIITFKTEQSKTYFIKRIMDEFIYEPFVMHPRRNKCLTHKDKKVRIGNL